MAVTQVFSGDTKSLEEAYRKLVAEDIKLRQALQETANQSKKHAKETADAFEKIGEGLSEQVMSIGQMVTGLFTVEKGVELVTDSFGEWRGEMKSLAAEYKTFADELTRTLGAVATIKEAPLVEAQAAKQRYASPAETTAAFREVAGAALGVAPERRHELAAAAAATAPLTENVGQMGRMVGNLGEWMPEKSGKELTGMALKMSRLAGNEADQLTSDNFLKSMKIFQQGGMAPEESLGLGVSALRQNVSPKLLETLAVGIENAPESVQQKQQRRGQPAEPLDEGQVAQNKLAATKSIQERLELVKQDEGVRRHLLGDKGAAEFGLVANAPDNENTVAQIRGSGNFADEEIAAAAADKGAVGRSMAAREAAQDKWRVEYAQKAKAMDEETKATQFDTTLTKRGFGPTSRGLAATGVAAVHWAEETAHGPISKFLGLEHIPGLGTAGGQLREKIDPAIDEMIKSDKGGLVQRGQDLGKRRVDVKPMPEAAIERHAEKFGPGGSHEVQANQQGRDSGSGSKVEALLERNNSLLTEQNSLWRNAAGKTPVNAHSE